MRRNSPFKDLFKTPQQKTYSLLVMTFFVVGVFFFFAIRPAFTKIAEINKQINQKEFLLKQIDTKISNLAYLKNLKEDVEDDIHFFDDAYPQKAETGYLVANFADIASDYDLILESIEFTDKVDSSQGTYFQGSDLTNVTLIQARLSVSGEIAKVQGYVNYLETLPRVVDIQSITYTKNTQSDQVVQPGQGEFHPYSAQIIAIMFYYGDPNAADQ